MHACSCIHERVKSVKVARTPKVGRGWRLILRGPFKVDRDFYSYGGNRELDIHETMPVFRVFLVLIQALLPSF